MGAQDLGALALLTTILALHAIYQYKVSKDIRKRHKASDRA